MLRLRISIASPLCLAACQAQPSSAPSCSASRSRRSALAVLWRGTAAAAVAAAASQLLEWSPAAAATLTEKQLPKGAADVCSSRNCCSSDVHCFIMGGPKGRKIERHEGAMVHLLTSTSSSSSGTSGYQDLSSRLVKALREAIETDMGDASEREVGWRHTLWDAGQQQCARHWHVRTAMHSASSMGHRDAGSSLHSCRQLLCSCHRTGSRPRRGHLS